MKTKYLITIIKQNSKGVEKIIDNGLFETRLEANNFIDKHQSELKPYKTIKNKVYHTTEAI